MSTAARWLLGDVTFRKRFADRYASGFARGVRRRSLRDALDALWALLRDPNDTVQGFRLLEALDPYIYQRELELIRRSPAGAQLLCERPMLLAALCDRATLDALRADSLGRAYREFCERSGIDPEAFVRIGEAGSVSEHGQDELVQYAAERARDRHDLWHVVSGCGSDLVGEAGVLGFTLAQTHSPGFLLLFIGALLKSVSLPWADGVAMRRLAVFGLRSGLRAESLAAVPWERWLERPLADVRAELGISEIPSYTPYHHHSSARS